MDKTQEEKLKKYEKFKERKEEQVIKNTGETYNFGDSTIKIYELPWIKADEFEDKVLELFKNIFDILKTDIDDKNLTDSLKKVNVPELLEYFLKNILRDGLVELAKIASQGQITMEKIIENKATKSQVIKIVTQAILLNYGYIKNLISLAAVVSK